MIKGGFRLFCPVNIGLVQKKYGLIQKVGEGFGRVGEML